MGTWPPYNGNPLKGQDVVVTVCVGAAAERGAVRGGGGGAALGARRAGGDGVAERQARLRVQR